MLEECLWIVEGSEHLLVLTAVFEGVSTVLGVLARVRILTFIILNIENFSQRREDFSRVFGKVNFNHWGC